MPRATATCVWGMMVATAGCPHVLAVTPKTTRVASVPTLKNAISNARPGDVILVADGNYALTGTLTVRSRGTASRPIVFRAERRGGAVFTGEFDGFWLASVAHMRIEGFVFAHRGKHAVRLHGCHHVRITRNHFRLEQNDGKSWWVYIDGKDSHHNRVDHCLFEGKHELGQCIGIEGTGVPELQISRHDRIDHNHFRDVGPRHKENGLETIRLGWSRMYASSAFATVEDNLFENCDGDAEVISVKCSDTTLRHNTFIDCQGALVLRQGDRNTVEGNFFLARGKKRGVGGVRVIGEDHRVVNNTFEGLTGTGYYAPLVLMNADTVSGTYTPNYHQVCRALVAHNTWVNCVGDTLTIGKIYKHGPLPVKDTVIANNIVVGYTSVGSENVLVKIEGEPDNLTWRGNIMYHTSAKLGIDVPASAIRWIDPRLVRSPDGVWRLAPGSPAIDAATWPCPAVTKDLDGQPRDAKRDVGADEYSADPQRRRPLTAGDVGIDADEPH